MSSNFGNIDPNIPKDIYIGVNYSEGYSALVGLEFSIAGMRFEEDGITLLSVSELFPVALSLGSFQAPADTSSTSSETGGINMAWSNAIVGSQPLIKLTLLITAPIANHVLAVERKYPPTNDLWNTPIFTLPDPPFYTPVSVTGGCYILNWSGDPNVGCDVITSVVESTWSGMKQLYR